MPVKAACMYVHIREILLVCHEHRDRYRCTQSGAPTAAEECSVNQAMTRLSLLHLSIIQDGRVGYPPPTISCCQDYGPMVWGGRGGGGGGGGYNLQSVSESVEHFTHS